MKKRTIACMLSAVALSAACLVGMAGCGGAKQVAATVDGTEIAEETITNDIQNMRMGNGLDAEEDWKEYLTQNGYTVKSLREDVIDSYVKKELIKKAAEKNEITVEDSEVQAAVDQMKANYDDDAKWQEALKSVKMTEEQYKDNIKASMLQKALMEKVVEPEDPSEDDVLMYAQLYSAYSWNGAKKSSHILVKDEETAKQVLKEINDGTISFKKAAKKYSEDTGSAADGGNVGWDCLNSFVSEYTDALSKLKKGQISEPVKSQFGYHIIKCTDVYNAPENIKKTSQVPSEMVDYLKSQISEYNTESKFDEWLEEFKKECNVVVNDMPEGLPYYVDLGSSSSSSADEDADDAAAAGDGETGADEDAADDSKEESK
ncbi:MAG: peptidylprolyl isomerase [Coriobacteriia bacterium]|nr:peptidylprolyl isomerase [Coriobacteriia bacterium]